MAATLCFKFLSPQSWLPLAQSVRHGSKAVTRHRKPVHFLKQQLLAVTEYLPPKRVDCAKAPRPKGSQQPQDNKLAAFLTKDVSNTFHQCKMIAVLQNNGSNAEDMLLLKHRLHKHEIKVKFFPNQIMRAFLAHSEYSNLAPLFIGPTVTAVSREPKLKEMLQVLRGSPQMVLLGACVEKTLLSQQGIVTYSKLPPLVTVQGQLLSALTLLTSQTGSMLQQPPTQLCALLQQHVAQSSTHAPQP